MSKENRFEVRVGNFIEDSDTIADSNGNVLFIDKDAIITLPTPEEIIREGAVEITLPTLPT
jgi:hypothetical protein